MIETLLPRQPLCGLLLGILASGASDWAQPAAAELPPPTLAATSTLPTTRVTTSAPEPLPDSRLVLEREAWAGRDLSLADLLQEQPGIQTRKFGGLGSLQTLSLRGLSGGQVLVFLDGVPLNGAGGEQVDLGKIPLEAIERIEVHKVFIPVAVGGNGLAGAVLLTSRDFSETIAGAPEETKVTSSGPVAEVQLGFGSFATHRDALNLEVRPTSRLQSLSHGALLTSAGDYPYFDRNRTAYNAADDTWRNRRNADYLQVEALQRLRWSGMRDQLGLLLSGNWDQGGLPGVEGDPTPTARSGDQQVRGDLSWRHGWDREVAPGQARITQSRLASEFALGSSWRTADFRWSDADHYPTNAEGWGRIAHRELQLQPRALLRWRPPHWDLTARLDGTLQDLEPRDTTGSLEAQWSSRRTQLQGALQADWFPIAPLQWSAAGGYLFSSDQTEAMLPSTEVSPLATRSPFAEAGVTVRPSAQVALFLQAAHHVRLPSLDELYGSSRGHKPNPALLPERSLKRELGVHWGLPAVRSSLEATLFSHRIEDHILELLSGQQGKSLNIGAVESQGVEFAAAAGIGPLTLQGNLTWQRARDASPAKNYRGHWLPNEPDWSGSGQAQWRWRLVTAEYRADARGPLYRDRANLLRLEPLLLHHAGLRFEPSPRLRVALGLDNLADEYIENPYSSWPYPGRSWSLQIQSNITSHKKE
jgi:outer membrane receptor protein involved in Fe transport